MPRLFYNSLRKTIRQRKVKHGQQVKYDPKADIALAIFQLRLKNKMSQANLAKLIGTKCSNIARVERGKRNYTIDTLIKLASALGQDIEVKFSEHKRFYGTEAWNKYIEGFDMEDNGDIYG